MEQKFFVKIENNNEWQGLLDKVLFKTFFHNPEWEEFLQKNFKWLKFQRYLYRDSALLSLAQAGKNLISHPFCEYGGPLPLRDKTDGRQFRDDLFNQFKAPLRINFHPHLLDYFQNMPQEGFAVWRKTYFLKQPDLSSLRYDIRHALKVAQSRGFNLEECGSQKDLENFYRLYLTTVKRHKNIPLPFSFFRFFNKNAKIFLLKSGKKIATGSVFLPNKPFLHYFITAADFNFRREGVNHLLLWQVLKNHLPPACDTMDLGATKHGSQLEIFKRGWRGQTRPIFEITSRSAQGGLRDSKLRNALGLMPTFLMRRISPYLLKYKL